MPGRIRRMAAPELESLLSRYGFVLISQKGSHRKWRHFTERRQVIVPYHGGRELPSGTLRTILQTSGIPESEWRAE